MVMTDLVHLAHLIIVLVQVIQRVFRLISHQVFKNNQFRITKNYLDLDHMKNMSAYGGAPHIWYSPILP